MAEYNNARRAAVLRSLIDALTRASPGGGKPIEFYSRDALRYVESLESRISLKDPIPFYKGKRTKASSSAVRN